MIIYPLRRKKVTREELIDKLDAEQGVRLGNESFAEARETGLVEFVLKGFKEVQTRRLQDNGTTRATLWNTDEFRNSVAAELRKLAEKEKKKD